MKLQIVFAITTVLTSQLAQADNIFQDSFNSATTFASRWDVSTAGNGGTTKVQNGKLTITTVGGSDGYMGIGDAVVVSPKLTSLDLTNKTIEFNLRELARTKNNGYKDNVSFALSLQRNEGKTLSVGLNGNYSGYDPEHPGDWNYYNTYNKHTLWFMENSSTGEKRILRTELSKSIYFNYFFRVTLLKDKVIIGYRREETPVFSYVTANLNGYNVPTKLSLTAWSGDGGYTRQNASGAVEVDSFVVYDNPDISGLVENLNGYTVRCADTTTGQTVTRAGGVNPKWQCTGLTTTPGDSVTVTLTGKVR